MGRSRGGVSTKLHAVVDTKGRPLYIALTPGHRHEMMKADELLEHAQGKALIGDTGYDSNRFRQAIRDRKMKPVISSKPERPRKLPKSRAPYAKLYIDGSIPSRTMMRAILDAIDLSLEARRPVYVHCFGGVGRTATVVACWLLRHGLATRADVLDVITRLRKADKKRFERNAPENSRQRDFVLGWSHGG